MGTKSLILIIIISSGHSILTDTMLRKPEIHLSEINKDLKQDKSKYQYVGADKCASVCHNNEKMGFQYNIWKTSPHSKAFKSLESKRAEIYAKKAHINENPQESPACLKCHTTAGDLDSTYITNTFRREEGVTCEACHKHEFVSKSYLPNEADCLKCHNDSLHKMHKFNFKGSCLKIAHPRPVSYRFPPAALTLPGKVVEVVHSASAGTFPPVGQILR